MSRVAIIGGTGVERLSAGLAPVPVEVSTPFGPCVVTTLGDPDAAIVFLARHGEGHTLAPGEVNYQRNIAALVALGVTHVLATNAVGSLRADLEPGALVLLSDFIDYTRNRPLSYWDGHPNRPARLAHTDFTHPYCPELRAIIASTAKQSGIALGDHGTYVCAAGPRYESPAEIRMFAQWGGDVIGMTGLPEAVFAREAGLCYAAIAIVTNYGAGLNQAPIVHEEVTRLVDEMADRVLRLLLACAESVGESRNCRCGV